jgi:hypothetical protein
MTSLENIALSQMGSDVAPGFVEGGARAGLAGFGSLS